MGLRSLVPWVIAVLPGPGVVAIARWPARADLFARKCDADRAEACLIALAGLRREARNV